MWLFCPDPLAEWEYENNPEWPTGISAGVSAAVKLEHCISLTIPRGAGGSTAPAYASPFFIVIQITDHME
jgi:hypothetical protein